jgi:hypothetical protein
MARSPRKERAISVPFLPITNVYRKQALVDKEPDTSVERIIYVNVRLAYGQSMFLVGESLHNDTGLTPVLLCAKFPRANVRLCGKAVRKVVLITSVNEDGFIKVLI